MAGDQLVDTITHCAWDGQMVGAIRSVLPTSGREQTWKGLPWSAVKWKIWAGLVEGGLAFDARGQWTRFTHSTLVSELDLLWKVSWPAHLRVSGPLTEELFPLCGARRVFLWLRLRSVKGRLLSGRELLGVAASRDAVHHRREE